MRKRLVFLIAAIFCLGGLYKDAFSQRKLAQTGFQFLSVGTDARATAMGEAFNTVEGSSDALFYNPAGLARMGSFLALSLNQMKWIADIQYYSGTMAVNVNEGRYGVLGLSFMTIDYGEFLWTRVANNEQGFVDYPEWADNPTALMAGIGYAKELSDKFSVGGQIKYAYQYLGKSLVPLYTEKDTITEEREYSLGVFAFDFGTLYKTGFKSLVFGMSVRNFSREVKYEKEGFQLPLTFKIGISFNAFDFLPGFSENHSLFISIDAVHPRSYPEYLNIGGEYVFMDMLALRAGYITNNDEYGLTTGFGVKKYGFEIDYSHTPFKIFDNVKRLSVKFSL